MQLIVSPSPLSRRSRNRRRGQALLLAVLIMIFAALLASAFIAVVSVNLNQTARQDDKNRAVVAAQAGLNYVNRQLTYGAEAASWRPTVPAAATPNYYSVLDRAQGWAGQFAKYPDPRAAQSNGPQFLAKVEKIPFGLPITNPDCTKAGSLKITVIGLSSEDPSAWNRVTAYKGGYQYAPVGQTMRAVGNYDFKNGVVPAGQANTYVSATRQLTLTNVKGVFPDTATPFKVMIGDPTTYTADITRIPRAAVVTAVTGNVLTLLNNPNPVPLANERVEVATSLGAPTRIDYDNNATLSTSESVAVNVADVGIGGIRNNGGLQLNGDVTVTALKSPNDGVSVPGTILTSGMLAKNPTSVPASTVAITGEGITGSASLLNSYQSTFPFSAAITVGPSLTKDQMVSDGWNRVKGLPVAVSATGIAAGRSRFTDIFQPPALDSKENLERYRNLTRYSPPANATDPATASLYGAGQGIYIDNKQDVEMFSDGVSTKLTEMTQSQLVNMWLSPSDVIDPDSGAIKLKSFKRLSDASPALATFPSLLPIPSLEQRHLRGWVGVDEFRARGVEIELGNNSITITRDARSDGQNEEFGGVANNTWKDNSGVPQPGVYSRTFDWPANGVIFAEGNVRIRGNATNVDRSLTVVSMGNIYIEDSISADDAIVGLTVGTPRKILLLAKKNVVMNPTRVLGRPDAQTVFSPLLPLVVVANTPTTLDVADTTAFKIGDFIQTSTILAGTETITSQGYVAAVNPTQLLYTPTLDGIVAPSSLIRTPSTPEKSVTVALPSPPSTTRLTGMSTSNVVILGIPTATSTDVIQRRFTTGPTTSLARLAFNHQGDRSITPFGLAAVEVNALLPKSSLPVYLANKRKNTGFTATDTTINSADKQLRTNYTQPSPGDDFYPNPPQPTDEADANTRTLSTADMLKSSMYAYFAPLIHTDLAVSWRYDVDVVPTDYWDVPFFYLASIGNRYGYGADPATIADFRPDINDINVLPDGFKIPMGTSVNVNINGGSATMQNEHYNGTAYDTTKNFGFNPLFLDPADTSREDILTSEQSFYDVDPIRSTLDSRAMAVNPGVSNSLVMRPNTNLTGFVGLGTINEYRLRSVKMENVVFSLTFPETVDTITPGYTFNVNAYVYAQTGSWFVIPSGLFNDRLRSNANTTYLDLNNDILADSSSDPTVTTNEYITVGAEKYPDLNRDGIIQDAERYAMARYARYNYQINFTGAIAENQAPLVNTETNGTVTVPGAVDSWMNSWATASKLVSGSPTITPGRMNYNFDPDFASGTLDTVTDTGFRIPQTTELHDVS